jgi:hypothetical protein
MGGIWRTVAVVVIGKSQRGWSKATWFGPTVSPDTDQYQSVSHTLADRFPNGFSQSFEQADGVTACVSAVH